MNLVKIENYELKVDDNLLLLKPFKKLYDSDTTKDKHKFMDFLSILYYTYDPRSDFMYIVDEEDRLDEVLNSNGIKVYKFNKQELICIDLYKKLINTASSLLLERTRKAVDKVGKFLEEVDLKATDDKGKPMYTVSTVVNSIKLVPKLSKDIMEAEKVVAKEIEEQGRAKGNNGTKKLMDDGVLF